MGNFLTKKKCCLSAFSAIQNSKTSSLWVGGKAAMLEKNEHPKFDRHHSTSESAHCSGSAFYTSQTNVDSGLCSQKTVHE